MLLIQYQKVHEEVLQNNYAFQEAWMQEGKIMSQIKFIDIGYWSNNIDMNKSILRTLLLQILSSMWNMMA